jgi:putative glutamine amidotransferase
MKKLAGISRCDRKFDHYLFWLERGNVDYKILDYKKNNFDDIKECSSLLLSGGDDIFPEFYNDFEVKTKRDEYIPERDGFEFHLLDYALQNNLPILGICRGMQLINCKLNGSLIKDIETLRGVNHRKIDDALDREHDVIVYDTSLLQSIVENRSGVINSSHHQGIDRLGEGLKVSAKSPDGIIESIEWDNKNGKEFFLGVQWHPERMRNMESPFTKKLLKRFREETLKH